VEPRTLEHDAEPRKRKFLGDPPLRVRLIVGLVFGVAVGAFLSLNHPEIFPGAWIATTSPWPMILFVASCGIIGGALAGFFRRARPHE
jgi:hypothetical protein